MNLNLNDKTLIIIHSGADMRNLFFKYESGVFYLLKNNNEECWFSDLVLENTKSIKRLEGSCGSGKPYNYCFWYAEEDLDRCLLDWSKYDGQNFLVTHIPFNCEGFEEIHEYFMKIKIFKELVG